MARALLHRVLSLSAAGAHATPRLAAAFVSSSAVVPLRSPLDERLLRLLRSEISYIAERRPPYPPPSSFKSFAVEDRPGEQWVRLRSGAGAKEEVKVEATMFDGAAEPLPEDAPLFQRVESLERGPRLHLSLTVEVIRGDCVLEFICSAWPDELAVRHVLTFREGGGSGLRDFVYGYCQWRRTLEKQGVAELRRKHIAMIKKERKKSSVNGKKKRKNGSINGKNQTARNRT